MIISFPFDTRICLPDSISKIYTTDCLLCPCIHEPLDKLIYISTLLKNNPLINHPKIQSFRKKISLCHSDRKLITNKTRKTRKIFDRWSQTKLRHFSPSEDRKHHWDIRVVASQNTNTHPRCSSGSSLHSLKIDYASEESTKEHASNIKNIILNGCLRMMMSVILGFSALNKIWYYKCFLGELNRKFAN